MELIVLQLGSNNRRFHGADIGPLRLDVRQSSLPLLSPILTAVFDLKL
jgi:hypothetical protein